MGATNDSQLLTKTLGILTSAEGMGADKTALLEAKLAIKSVSQDRQGFESILAKIEAQGHPSAHLLTQFARHQYIHGDYKQSLAFSKEATALNPSFNNYYYIVINELALANYDSARKILKKMINMYPERWKAHNILGVIELETGNLDSAENVLTSIPEALRDPITKSNLGTVYFLQGKYELALQVYLEILNSTPNNLRMITQTAETYLMLSNVESAQTHFQKVINLTENSTFLKDRQFRAEALAYLSMTPASIALIKDLLREAPESTYVKHTAAQVYALAEEWQSANYHLEDLISKGMTKEWFTLPAFQQLCLQPQTSQVVRESICH